MKIAFIVSEFPVLSQTFIVNQITSLIDRGFEIDIIAKHKGDSKVINKRILEYGLLSKAKYSVIPSSNKFKRVIFFFNWIKSHFLRINWRLFFWCLSPIEHGKKAIDLSIFFNYIPYLSGKYGIYHAHFGHNAKDIAELKSKGFFGDSKLITTFHGYDIRPDKINFYKKDYNLVLSQSSALTVNTLYTKGILDKVNPELKNIFVLPVGLDTNFFKKERNEKNQRFTILWCGRLVEFKSPDFAVDIVNKLLSKGYDVKLQIVGDGILKDKLREKIKDLGIEENVQLLGALNQEKLRVLMEKAHVFLASGQIDPQTKRAENQGLVIQEAQAMELPVVVSDAGGMKYGVLNKDTGFICQQNDIDDFVEVLSLLYGSRELRVKLGQKGRNHVVKNYDSKLLCEQLEEIYNLD